MENAIRGGIVLYPVNIAEIKCGDFLDLAYEPLDTGLVSAFYVKPASDTTVEEAASRVASGRRQGESLESRAESLPGLEIAIDRCGTETPR